MAKKKKEAIVYKTIRVKGTRWNQNPERYYTYMECKKCGAYENASESSISVTCSKCVEEMWTAAAKISVLKKELAKTKFKKDKKVIESNIKYFSRIALGKRMPKDYMERLYGEKVS